MLHYTILGTTLLSALTGATVVALGEWKRFVLKFAAVAMLLVIDVAFSFILCVHPDELANPYHPQIFDTVGFLIIAKSIAHILIYIAFGRDAIAYRKGDRRAIYPYEYRKAA